MRDLRKDPLRIGIVGCGSFVLRRVLPVVRDVETIRVVCVQNRDLGKAKEIAGKYGIHRAVSRREELLGDPKVEAVFVTSASFLHEEDAVAAAEAGKPTLCEKPLSISLESVERMLLAFRSRGVPFFVGHQLRFKPAIQKAKKLVEEGALGRLLYLRAFFHSRTIPEGNWRLVSGNGGGPLEEIGIHLVDLFHFLTGEKIENVHAMGRFSSEGVDTAVSFQGQLQGGGIVSFECSFEGPYYSGFEVIGTKSRLVSSESLRQTLDPVESLCQVLESGERVYFPLTACDLYVEELKHFAEAVVHGVPSFISAEISYENQRVIDLAYEALSRQKNTLASCLT